MKSLFPVRDGAPSCGHAEFEGEARLQVRLVKARECGVRAGGYEQRVYELRVAVERGVARPEIDFDCVVTRDHFLFRNDDVIRNGSETRRRASRSNSLQMTCTR